MSTKIYLWKRSRYCDESNYKVVAKEFSSKIQPIFVEKKWMWTDWDDNGNFRTVDAPTEQDIENRLIDMFEKDYQTGQLLLWNIKGKRYFGLEKEVE